MLLLRGGGEGEKGGDRVNGWGHQVRVHGRRKDRGEWTGVKKGRREGREGRREGLLLLQLVLVLHPRSDGRHQLAQTHQ